LTLMWDPSIDPSVVGYRVSYGTASGSYNIQMDAGNQSSLVVDNLDDQTAYYFIVQAYDLGQAHFSIPSSEVAYRPLSMSCQTASAASPDGNPVVVNYPAPIVVGATPQTTVTCVPPSGSAFAVGATYVSCTATDVVTATACMTTVTVSYAGG